MKLKTWKTAGKTVLALALGTGLLAGGQQAAAAQRPADIEKHWAKQTIELWLDAGWAKGYQDGLFHPEKTITRAEWAALLNRSNGFTETQAVAYQDVKANAWYASDLQKAKAAGYMTGYTDGTFHPDQVVSRQELAVTASKLLNWPASVTATNPMADQESVASWAQNAVGAAMNEGVMVGAKDKNGKLLFRPASGATRAEALVVADRILSKRAVKAEKEYNTAGVFGPETGSESITSNVRVTAGGVTLRNLVIAGDLYIDKKVGEADVTLTGVTVKGKTYVSGGGSHSVRLNDSIIATLIVDREGAVVRVVASGSSTIQQTQASGSAILEESDLNGTGFGELQYGAPTASGSQTLTLRGSFDNLTIAGTVTVALESGKVTNVEVASTAGGTRLQVGGTASVGTLTLKAGAQVEGDGKVDNAVVQASGVTFTNRPGNLHIAGDVKVNVAGKEEKGTTVPGTGVGGGTQPGGTQPGNTQPGGTVPGDTQPGDTNPPTPQQPDSVANKLFAAAKTAKGGTVIVLSQTPPADVSVWFAPASTNVFAAGSTATTYAASIITAPAAEGDYKLYVVSAQGQVQSVSDQKLKVDNTPPAAPDTTIFPGLSAKGGASVAVTGIDAANDYWLAAFGTTDFTSGNVSKAAKNGTKASITAPIAEGDYRLYAVDAAGNVSQASGGILKVDNTRPTEQNTLLTSSVKAIVQGGRDIMLSGSIPDKTKVWLAPQGSTQFTPSSTMTFSATTTIAAPAQEGVYRLYLIDEAGNISLPSELDVTVDNTAPDANAFIDTLPAIAGGSLTLKASLPAGWTAWIAPAVTTDFVANITTITKATSGTSVTLPSQAAQYKLFIVDAAGNVSRPSNVSITVQ